MLRSFANLASVELAATVPADHTVLLEIATAGRLVHGTEMTMPNGSKLAFGER